MITKVDSAENVTAYISSDNYATREDLNNLEEAINTVSEDLQNLEVDLEAAIEIVSEDLSAHIASEMPHRFVDGGSMYKYGFKATAGVLSFVYDEVI